MDPAVPNSHASPIRTLVDIPRYRAAKSPNAIALSFEGRETTYRQFDEFSSRVANGLISAGVNPAARVAILDKNSDLFIEILFGAVKANAVLVPVNARLAPPEIAYIVNDAKAEILFIAESFGETIEKIRHELVTVREIIVLNSEYVRWRDAQQATDPELPVSPEDICVQMYTSGTTGHPKGVQLSHQNFTLAFPEMLEAWGKFSSSGVLLLVMPLFHIAGCDTAVLGLYAGLKTIICREFVPSQVLRIIEAEGVSVTFLVPAMLLAILGEADVERFDVSSLKQVIYGASPIPIELLKNALRVFKHAGFVQVYGLTETAGAITTLSPQDHAAANPDIMRSCGRAIAGVEIRIVDRAGKSVPVRQVGEIICRTIKNMKGYWNRPEDTARTMKGDWLHTGDAGYLDENGYLFIHDRVKDMIVSGGENIYPAEIESALYGHPDIVDIAVIGVPDERWGEAVKALIILRKDCTPDSAGILDYARERLAGFKIPKSIEFLSKMPRNPSGKILKRELRERFWQGHQRRVN
jgi:acyl-CoA synthetase (AMP-forming)/AMP-acid ligase II